LDSANPDHNNGVFGAGWAITIMILLDKQVLIHKHLFALLALMMLPCFFIIPNKAKGLVSTNVPLDHWSYESIDKLIGEGLIDGSMMTTRPVSRFEMARHIKEADEKFQLLNSSNEIITGILDRLKNEFEPELAAVGASDGKPVLDYAKPIEDPYLKYVYADSKPDIENNKGDRLDKNSNLRAGFESRAQLFDITAFYAHVEYPWSSEDESQNVELIEGYGKLMLGKYEVEAGKDSMWWGPGYHGSMLMSSNAEPFKMIKLSNPTPVSLPWIFQALGPFKVVWFLTQLEDDRPIPEPLLTGIRLNFKPHPAVELGLSRTMIFGGEGRDTYSLNDYFKALLGRNESLSGDKDNDQLGGFDASVLVPFDWLMPVKTAKLYTDWVGEDEAGGLPSNWGYLYGIKLFDIFKTGKTDLCIEYANNHISGKPNAFYTHHIYTAGYTYKGRVIGHFMGTDSENLFFRLTHYLNKDIILGLQYDTEKSNLSSSPQPKIDRIQSDITLFTTKNWRFNGGYRYEHTKNTPLPDNNIVFMQLTYDF
jgi:hypothetical protein